MTLTWLLITWLSLPGILASSAEQWLMKSAYLDQDRRFFMQWGSSDQEDIYIKLEVKTLGYVTLGFSRKGTMVDSDIVVGWVANGQVHLQDKHTKGNKMLAVDDTQNYELISGSENATHTILFFRRKWNTCDPQDFTLEFDNTIRVLHAYSSEDPVDDVNLPYINSSNRGWRSFMLLQPKIPTEKNVEFWDVTLTVSPEWDTKYWCKLFKVPGWEKKHHVTKIEPLIEGGNQGHVHHIVFFNCPRYSREYDQHLSVDGYDCLSMNSPNFTRECNAFHSGWSYGGERSDFPEHYGFPLFPDRYMLIEVHYTNMNRDTGSTGRAGLRLHHTPNLRQFDASVFVVGSEISANVMAPPGIPDFLVTGHSNPECIKQLIPAEGVTLASLFLHSHVVGSRIKTRHFRKNIELTPLIDNRHYDPQFHEIVRFRNERLLLPGDQLTVECTYDTTNRTTTTMGGFGVTNEMCLSYIFYYPRIEDLYSCSLPQLRTVSKFVGSKKLDRLTAGKKDYDQKFVDFMTDYDWNKTDIKRFEGGVRFSNHDSFCHLGTKNINIRTKSSYPEGLQEYVEKPQCDQKIEIRDQD